MIATLQSNRSFSPASLNPAAWFRYGIGITSAATAVSQWDDQSGNGRHLKQATGAAQPALQGDGSILFDGTSDFLKCDAFTLNQPETIYVLGKQITWTSNDRWLDGNALNAGTIQQVGISAQLRAFAGNYITGFSEVTLGTYVVLSVLANGASSVFQVNSATALAGDIGASNMGGLTLGAAGDATGFGNVQIKELIVFASAHNAATRASVIAYLNGVGGL